jgi:hypothetical protein
LLLALYVGLYVTLSRRGYAEADRYSMHGFYHFTPEDSDSGRSRNYACVYLFWPLAWGGEVSGFRAAVVAQPLTQRRT